MEHELPIVGCWLTDTRSNRSAQVIAQLSGSRLSVSHGPGKEPATLSEGEWRSGFQAGYVVQDQPISNARQTLGMATVVATRQVGGREQVCIQLHETGELRWLPYERLRRIMDPRVQFVRAEQHSADAAERTSLNLMAHALSTWNEATGALERLDVDPLPHQITLVHRILSSGTTNWLIADDVGLGKTIEVGLLLGALERRQTLRRVLLVVPSGLTQQWKDELLSKFDQTYRIWGGDFEVATAEEWGLYEKVIVSLDLAKPRNNDDDGIAFESRFGKLLAAGKWDLVVFDEAHRLSRDDAGRTTLRYRLANALRKQTDAMLLLSGTPHQGDVGKFQNLLRLVRPELETAIEEIDEDASFIGDLVLRNRKIDAVDARGEFIFAGLLVRRAEIPSTEAVQQLEHQLSDYLKRGYRAGDEHGGTLGRAIGFVMTIYRKLASSSVYALHVAMVRRRQRLLDEADNFALPAIAAEDDESDETDDLSEVDVRGARKRFFEDELSMLDALINQSEACFTSDAKFTELRKLTGELVRQQGKKLLVFTEYRSTQFYLSKRLESIWGKAPALINGGMSVAEKAAAIVDFENENNILISTEAGGEGLNLHRACHVMVNYDLPWNPARLSQRIGRLYRYGQKEKVIVVNFTAKDTIDGEIMSTVLERLEALIVQMASVSAEFDERYKAEVLGELLERVSISDLLEEAREGRIERSRERIEDALRRAQEAKKLQDDLLAAAHRMDSDGWQRLGAFSTTDLARFIGRASLKLGIGHARLGSDAELFEIRLPEALRGRFPEFGRRTVIEARTSRDPDARSQGRLLLDFSSPFVRYLVDEVTGEAFGGRYGFSSSAAAKPAIEAAVLVHFQNDQGELRGKELMVAHRASDGSVMLDNRYLRALFEAEQQTGAPPPVDQAARMAMFDAMRDRVEAAAAETVTPFRHINAIVPLGVVES